MEVVIFLVVGFLVVVGGFVFVILGGVIKVENDQNKAERNAVGILDATFNGAQVVTFTPHMRTLKAETVIAGAIERGYKLTHQAGDRYSPMVFERITGT